MARDYRYEILKYLYDNSPNNVNIKPLILNLVSEGIHSRTYFGNMIQNMMVRRLVWADDLITLSVSRQGIYDDERSIMARIEPDGIELYLNQKKLYEPEIKEKDISNSVYIGGDVVGSMVGSQSSFDKVELKPIIDITNNTIPKHNNKRLLLEKLYWAAGIVLGIIAVIMAFKKC